MLLPLPPFNLGLLKGHERGLLASVAKGEDVPLKRIEILLEGHVAALIAISGAWAPALNMDKGGDFKKCSASLLPAWNEPSGSKQMVANKFASVGGNFVKRDKSFRHTAQNLLKPYTKCLNSARRVAAKARSVL